MTDPVLLYAEMESTTDRDRVSDLLRSYGTRVRQEPGCLFFEATQLSEHLDRFFVIERYRDDAAFQEHLAADHCRDFNAAVAPLIVGGASRLTRLTAL